VDSVYDTADGSAQAASAVRHLAPGPNSRTRDRILAAGIACCAALRSDRVTMQDVADRSGFSRKTIYRYFRDRDDLFLAIDHYERHLQNSEIAARLAEDATLQDAIRVVVEVHLERVLGLYRLREHFKNDDIGYFRSLFIRHSARADAIRRILGDRVAAARASGELRPGIADDQALDWIIASVQNAGITAGMVSFDEDDIAQTVRFYTDNICRALTAS
jgi:AcrR family transcriptional regulator